MRPSVLAHFQKSEHDFSEKQVFQRFFGVFFSSTKKIFGKRARDFCKVICSSDETLNGRFSENVTVDTI